MLMTATSLLQAAQSPTGSLTGDYVSTGSGGYLGGSALLGAPGENSVLAPAHSAAAPSVAGVLMGAGLAANIVGSFFGMRSAQNELKAQALSLQGEQTMAAINARRAEQDAQTTLQAGGAAIARRTLAAGQEQGAIAATTAGRGIVAGVGSAAEVQASSEIAKAIDVMDINVNAVREAGARRAMATNDSNRASLLGVSAANTRRSAGNGLLPLAAAGGAVLSTASRIGERWAARNLYPDVQ